MDDRYAKIRDLLANETYPLLYTHKLIGANTPQFEAGLQDFEASIAGIVRKGVRLSTGDAHMAVTYSFRAPDVEAVIAMLEASARIPGLKMIL
jgi:hypothetical protein